jgi:hypothetical protein
MFGVHGNELALPQLKPRFVVEYARVLRRQNLRHREGTAISAFGGAGGEGNVNDPNLSSPPRQAQVQVAHRCIGEKRGAGRSSILPRRKSNALLRADLIGVGVFERVRVLGLRVAPGVRSPDSLQLKAYLHKSMNSSNQPLIYEKSRTPPFIRAMNSSYSLLTYDFLTTIAGQVASAVISFA